MSRPPLTHRQSDIVLTVEQANQERTLAIADIEDPNQRMQHMLHYAKEEITALPLQNILAPSVNEALEDYLEFSEEGADLYDVLRRTPRFALLSKANQTIPVSVRIERAVITNHNPQFLLVIHPESGSALIAALKAEQQRLGAQGMLAPQPEILLPILSVCRNHIEQWDVEVTLAYASIDRTNEASLMQVAAQAESILRESDIVSVAGQHMVMVLPDTGTAQARTPLQRVEQGLRRQQIDTTIAYQALSKSLSPEQVQQQLAAHLSNPNVARHSVEEAT